MHRGRESWIAKLRRPFWHQAQRDSALNSNTNKKEDTPVRLEHSNTVHTEYKSVTMATMWRLVRFLLLLIYYCSSSLNDNMLMTLLMFDTYTTPDEIFSQLQVRTCISEHVIDYWSHNNALLFRQLLAKNKTLVKPCFIENCSYRPSMNYVSLYAKNVYGNNEINLSIAFLSRKHCIQDGARLSLVLSVVHCSLLHRTRYIPERRNRTLWSTCWRVLT